MWLSGGCEHTCAGGAGARNRWLPITAIPARFLDTPFAEGGVRWGGGGGGGGRSQMGRNSTALVL